MIEILKLGRKKYFQNKYTRKYYNLGFLSWKFFLFVNIVLMLYFFLFCDSDNSSIQLMQVVVSGIFISILAYVATIVIPERNCVDRILNTLENLFFEDLFSIFSEASPCTDDFLSKIEYYLYPQLIILGNSFGMISREVGILRCSCGSWNFFRNFLFLKKEMDKLIALLKESEKDETKIKEKINLIKSFYIEQIIPGCKVTRGYYFLEWKNFYLEWKNFDKK